MEASPGSKTAELDAPLTAVGFEIDEVSPRRITGRLDISDRNCQPFKVLHGGVSALISEALASMGAHMASGYRRVAGAQLSINHFRPARLGERVLAVAEPLHVGRSTQVWQVQLWKTNTETGEKGEMVSSARVTLLTNLPVPDDAKNAADGLKKHSKL